MARNCRLSPSGTRHTNRRLSVWVGRHSVQTIFGPLPSFDTRAVRRDTLQPRPSDGSATEAKEGYFLYGHKMMIVGGVVSHSGASNVAGQGGSQGNTLGLGNSSGNGIPQVGAVIAECQIDSGVIKQVTNQPLPPKAEAPKPEATAMAERRASTAPSRA